MAAMLAQYYFRLRMWWSQCLQKSVSISKQNFVDIHQSTAET